MEIPAVPKDQYDNNKMRQISEILFNGIKFL